jgi:hypothetical protein
MVEELEGTLEQSELAVHELREVLESAVLLGYRVGFVVGGLEGVRDLVSSGAASASTTEPEA